MNQTLVPIYFFDGAMVRSQDVSRADLPKLSSERTFWRESMSEGELAKLLKRKIAAKLSHTPELAGSAKNAKSR